MKLIRGYTLLEMMVSIALFSLVMLLATGAFLKFMVLDRKARITNDVVNNLSFAVDSMSRTIRTGSQYRCGGQAASPNCWSPTAPRSSFTFLDDRGREVTYYQMANGSIGVCALAVGAVCSDSVATALTDSRVVIQNMKFYVRGVGTDPGNNYIQPHVIFVLKGYMKPDPTSANIDFTIQTMASQRLIEI